MLLASCASFDVYRVEVVDTLYFGTEKSDHTFVTNEEWRAFQRDVIETKLDGYTTWDAVGEWRSNGRTYHESTHVVQVVHTGSADRAIAEIIAAYKSRFAQESVLRVRAHAGVAFQ